jgi:hypothetical protein
LPLSKGIFLSFSQRANAPPASPLDVVQSIATENGWQYEGIGGDEIVFLIKGRHTDYQVFFSWMRHLEVFHLACSFELTAPKARVAELLQLVGSINEQLWVGHFDLWASDSTVVFRQALPLVGGITASARQCEVMLGTALNACERYYPAFQCVLASQSASEALAAAMFETAGEA